MIKELRGLILVLSILFFNSCGAKKEPDDKNFAKLGSHQGAKKDESYSSADEHADMYPPCHIMVGLPKKYYATYLWPNKKYYGHLVIEAEFNKYTLKFFRFDIAMAKLYLKESNTPFEPDSIELASLLTLTEKRIGHVQVIPYFRPGCQDLYKFYIPVEVK